MKEPHRSGNRWSGSLVQARHRIDSVTRRNPLFMYAALGAAAVSLVVFAISSLVSVIVESWSVRDVELRSQLVFRSIHDQVAADLVATPRVTLVPFLEQIAEDERLLALGFCSDSGQLEYATKLLPKSVTCKSFRGAKTDTFTRVFENGQRLYIAVFPIKAGTVTGHLLVVHDLSYISGRVRQAQFYSILAFLGIAACLGVLATAIVFALMRTWTRSVRSAIVERRFGGIPARNGFPISQEIQSLLDEVRGERKFADGIHVEWSPKTLHRLLVEELPGARILVVSNREPYIHNRAEGSTVLQIPASGLVAALEPVMRACGGTWIAHGSGSADRETVDRNDRIRVPPDSPTYTLRRIWITDEEQDGYYYGFANEGLWPLCHIAFVRPIFREQDWAQYKVINERFADAVVEEAGSEDPIVLVQDYHFALLPRMVHERLPKATIITFWHIPWPNSEAFGICPWREQIIDGLLGSTILGFHTRFHCNNFLEAADRFMESRIDREYASVTFGGHETMVRPYPISIEWPPAALAHQAPVRECRDAVRRRFSLPPTTRIAVGIERFDYTKGVLDRINAVDDLLTREPRWKGALVLIQAAAPTRSKLDAYRALQTEAVRLAEEVNRRHGDGAYRPIQLVIRHHEPHEVYELFRRPVHRVEPTRWHELGRQRVCGLSRRRTGRSDSFELRWRFP